MRNPERGFNPEENQENDKPKRKIQILKKADLNLKNFEVDKEQDGVLELKTVAGQEKEKAEKQNVRDFAAELKLAVEEKEKDRLRYKDLDDFDKIFNKDK